MVGRDCELLQSVSTHEQVIDVVRRVSPQIRASIVMFTYFNPIMRRGAEQFCRDIREAGASGQSFHCFHCSESVLNVLSSTGRGSRGFLSSFLEGKEGRNMIRLSCSFIKAPSRTARQSGAQHHWNSHARTVIIDRTVLR